MIRLLSAGSVARACVHRFLLKSSSSSSKKKSSSSSSSGKHSKQKPEHHQHLPPAVPQPTAPAPAPTSVPPSLPYVGLPSSMQGKYGEVPRNFLSAVPIVASNSVSYHNTTCFYIHHGQVLQSYASRYSKFRRLAALGRSDTHI